MEAASRHSETSPQTPDPQQGSVWLEPARMTYKLQSTIITAAPDYSLLERSPEAPQLPFALPINNFIPIGAVQSHIRHKQNPIRI